MKKMMQEAQNRLLALRGRYGSSASRGDGSRRVPKKLIVVTSMVLLVAIFSSILMLGVVPGGKIEAMAGTGSLTSVSGENTIPGQYSPVNVPAGTYIMKEYGTVTQSGDGLAVFDFHIFAEKFASTAHTCGNIAVKELGKSVLGTSGAPEFGSRAEHDTDSIKLSYVGEAHGWSAATKVENQIFGSKVKIEGNGQVFLVDAKGTKHMMGNDNNGSLLNNIYIDTVPGGEDAYIDINGELDEAESYMRWLVWLMDQAETSDTPATTTVTANNMDDQNVVRLSYSNLAFGGGMGFGFFGWGGTTIDLSKYDAETIIIDLDAGNKDVWGQSDATRLISGMVKLTGTTGKRVIFNIDATNAGPELKFSDTTMTADKLTNTEDSANKDNNILWNFYERKDGNKIESYKGKITVGGTWMGTINAPKAKVFCRAGLNGSIIAKEVATTAETHKSDYTGERVAKTNVDLTVTKIWEDNKVTRPEFITLQLLRDGKVISTVQIGAKDNNTGNSDTANTDYKWYYVFKDLPATDEGGNTYQYKVQELPVPGYETSQVNNTIINTSTSEEVVVTTYQLTVEKTDGSKALPDAVLSLTGANLSGAIVEGGKDVSKTDKEITWTSTGSAVVIKNLPAGNYTVSEVSAPDGYKLAAAQSFNLGSDKTVTVVNTPIEVTFNKLNSNNVLLSEAQFKLTSNWGVSLENVIIAGAMTDSVKYDNVKYDSANNAWDFTTNGAPITFEKIAAGSYTLTETAVPDASKYQLAAPITFIVDAQGNVTVNGNSVKSVDVYNYDKPAEIKYYNLTVNKNGEGVNGNLAGATLQLIAADKNADLTKTGKEVKTVKDEQGNVKYKYIEWTTTGSADIYNLPEGSYTIKEISAPNGYKLAADVSVTIKGGDNTVTMHDELIKLNVAKVDSVSGAYVSGATLSLTSDTGYSNSFITTGALIELSSGLKAGTYTLTETDAPDGYVQPTEGSNSQTFTIDAYGNVSGANVSGITVTMKNTPSQISIIKQYWKDTNADGVVDSDETDRGYLAGATLTLTGKDATSGAVLDLSNVTGTTPVEHSVDAEGNKDGKSITWVSGSAANVLRGLPDGNYTLTEDEAPLGYEKAAPITFAVSGGKVTGDSVTLYNRKVVYRDLEVNKVDKSDTSKNLAGATLAIFKEGTTDFDAKNAEYVFQTTADGPNKFKLPAGKYILVELAAPEGYNLSTEKVEFELKADGSVSGGNNGGNTGGTTTTPTTPTSSTTTTTTNNNTTVSSGQFVLGALGNMSAYDNGNNRVSVEITDAIKAKAAFPTSVELYFKDQSDTSNPYISQIRAAYFYTTTAENITPETSFTNISNSGSSDFNTLTSTSAGFNSYKFNDGVKYDSSQRYFLSMMFVCQRTQAALTTEQFNNFGLSGKLTFSDGSTVTIGGTTASASAYEIASGISVTDDKYVYGLPNGLTSSDVWGTNFTPEGNAHIDITDALKQKIEAADGGVELTKLSIPKSSVNIWNLYASIFGVNSDGSKSPLALTTASTESDGNVVFTFNPSKTFTSSDITDTADTTKNKIVYFVFGFNPGVGADSFANSGVNSVTLYFDSDTTGITVGNGVTTQPSQPAVTTGTLTMNVKDNNGNSLSGIKFKLQKDNADYKFDLSSNNGQIVVSDLPLNSSYRFVLTGGSESQYYITSKDNIATDSITLDSASEAFDCTVSSRVFGKLTLVLTDGSSTPLDGGSFKLQRSTDGGNSFADYSIYDQSVWETQNGGRFEVSNLEAGYIYRFEQTSAPEGYTYNTSYTDSVTISEDNLWNNIINVTNTAVPPTTDDDFSIGVDGDKTVVITFANTKTPVEDRFVHSLKLKKIGNDNSALAGATFNLFNSNGKLIKVEAGSEAGKYNYTYKQDEKGNYVAAGNVKDLVTGADGYIYVTGLEVGDYYLYETKAPDGYILSDERADITVTDANTNTNYAFYKDDKGAEIAIVNVKQTASLIITKLDTNGRPLPGAVFELHSVDLNYANDRTETVYGPNGETSTTFTTENDGNYTFTGLEPNRIYYVVEKQAPAGMKEASDTKYPDLSANITKDTSENKYYNAHYDANKNTANLYGIALGKNIKSQVLTWTDSNSNGACDQGEFSYVEQTADCLDGTISITNEPVQTVIKKTDGSNALADAVLKLEPVRTEGAENVSSTTELKDPALSNVTIAAPSGEVSFSDVIDFTYTESNGEQVVSGINYEYLTWTTTGEDSIFYGLPAGKYILSELEAPVGYEIAAPMEITIEADGQITYNGSSNLNSVEMVDSVLKTQIDITKVWNDNNNQDALRPVDGSGNQYITVVITGKAGDAEVYNDQLTITGTGNNWSYTVNDLPMMHNGQEIVYTVEEINVPDAYTSVVARSITGGFVITNSYKDTYVPEITQIEITKIWNDNNNQDNIRPESITVDVLANGKVVEGMDNLVLSVDDPNVELSNNGNNWTWTITGLTKNANGSAIEYTVVEVNIDDRYTASVNDLTITNSYAANYNPAEVDITVTKVWDDANDQAGFRPDYITVDVLNGETVVMDNLVLSKNDSNVELIDNNTWKWTITGLTKNANGSAISYTVQEVNVDSNYTASDVTGDMANGFSVTNSHTPAVTEITITKNWVDENDQDRVRPGFITVKVLANGSAVEGMEALVLNKDDTDANDNVTTISVEGNSWAWTISGLPKYADGEEITYTVQEVNVDNRYTASDVTGDMENGFSVTNTHTVGKTDVTVVKQWIDNDNRDGIRPASITVNLMANGSVIDSVVLTADNNWTYKWEKLDLNADGQQITYTVAETAVPNGYSASVDGYTIKNTHAPATTEITVTKIWNDNNNQDTIRPTSVTVTLTGMVEGNEVYTETKTMTGTGDEWNCKFDNLYKKYNGKFITYTVAESAVGNYEPTYAPAGGYTASDESAGGALTITNTHTPEVTKITINKIWADANDQDGIRPDRITVKVMANGTAVTGMESLVLTKVDTNAQDNIATSLSDDGNTWTWEISGLPKNADGSPIAYTVEEINVDSNYTASAVTGDMVNGFSVTNTHTPEVTKITVTKIWADANDQDDIRPDRITVKVLANGTAVTGMESLVLTKVDTNAQDNIATSLSDDGNTWTWEISGLPKNADGSAIAYTVEEINVDSNYTASAVTGDMVNGFSVTNTHTPETVEIAVNKIWINGSYSGANPTSITVQLVCNGIEVEGKTQVLNAENVWSHKWTNLPKFSGDAENPNRYTVKELDVLGYESVVTGTAATGFTVTNTRIADGQITLIKTDADNSNIPVVGAKFKLEYRVAGDTTGAFVPYKVNDVEWTGTTNNEGKIVVSDLYWGYEYKFVEVEAAPGFSNTLGYVNDETVTLRANDMGKNVDFYVTNERITTDATFTKTDAATSEPLVGATIKITNNDGASLTDVTGVTDLDTENASVFQWISGEQPVVLSGLPAGSYTMTEITAPYGYEMAEAIEFVIGDDGKVYTYGANDQLVPAAENKVEMKDQPVTAEISKLSAATTAELPGATLTLTLLSADNDNETLAKVYGSIAVERANDNMSVTWRSGNAANTLYALPDGQYKLEEKSAPAGYEIAEEITFTIKDGEVVGGKVEMLDAYTTSNATISKKETGAGDELPGAVLTVKLLDADADGATLKDVTGTIEVTRSDDNMSVTWTSGNTANTLSALPDGIYELKEVTAPDGYEVAEIMYFRVDSGSVYSVTKNGDTFTASTTPVDKNTVLMRDEPVKATISKQEVGGGDELPGAELTVTLITPVKEGTTLEKVTGSIDVTHSTDKKSVTWVSEDEANVLSRLPEGVYSLTEVTEPDGYKVAEVIYFIVEDEVVYSAVKDGNTYKKGEAVKEDTVVMEDAPVTATISKQEVGGGDELPGAELTVTLVTPENKDATLEKVTGTIDVKYDDKTNSVTWVSEDEANTLSRLPDGIYTLTEVTAPAGYKVAEVMYFKVEDGVVYNTEKFEDKDTDWEEADDEKVIMEDAPVTANISKQAVGGGAELAGAKLTVKLVEAAVKGSTLENTAGSIKVDYNKKTNSVSWTSGDKANTLSILPDGIYSLTETQAPAGYEIAETMYFKIDKGVVYNTTDYKEGKTEWKKVDNSTIVMYDALTPADGTASFVKKSDLGNSLAGAVFTLKDSEGKTKTATSNANGIVSFTGLDAGQYELTETTAPTGYTKSSQKVIVKVADDGTVSWFTTNGDGIPVASVEVLFTNTYIIKPGTTPEKPVVGGKVDLSDNLDTALKDLDVEWSSSDSTIADVDQNGVVTVKKPGNFTITVTVNGKPVQNFVLGATDTNNSGTNGTTGTAPETGNKLVEFGVTASAVLLGGFALMAAVVYGYKRKKIGSAKK